ncbi:L,D-transpeptidase family protein [Sphingomonas bacterium]|uniref:L,D-transpeptidase family protein n=1 Tax=Sphingomonas bacterium TaxID=1895847 RepID=UPI0026203217|nr:L,D-transpeptidase family protein [Sphingomonas bacterium]
MIGAGLGILAFANRTVPPATVVVAVPEPVRMATVSRPAPKPSPTPAPLVVRSVLPISGPLKFGEHHWDETRGVTGPLIITVDLEAQVLSVFRDGHEIGATAILYGDNDKPTPLGHFPITEKDAVHVSSIYGSPMPYMLRLTNDGISVHGAEVEWGYATHGCIGVPVAFAKKLFGVVKLGDVVIITRGKTLTMGQPITA